MVCMAGALHGRHSTRITARNSDPAVGEESNNTFGGYVTLVTDDETLLVGENTRGISSPVLRDIDDDVSLTTQGLGSSFSPHTGLSKYLVFMARETS